ncbi:GNAT family N-acetyltransferase [Ktedonobacter racemifer]|uniref:GCN5-related N-acetyltransferase n=1 Tax=Ktedonobacter racemifer DSM 44963 TaxID=485913 RepID=D6U0Q2_KTERA|nr:GNAT family N-acetyltransferase [Ktedonobacter racemifer]EFH82392.1 GCN5-related N-acetyltransferase [Ktedonobacter racemifer DSM 44963]
MTKAVALPDDFWVRPAITGDLEAVLQVLIAQEMADFGKPLSERQNLWRSWHAEGFNLLTDTWVVGTSSGHIIGYACARGSGHVRLFANVWLLPEYTGSGIGGFLLHCAEMRAGEWVAAAPPGTRVTMGASWISERNQRAQRLLEHKDYKKIYSFAHMQLDLDAAPVPAMPGDGIVIRPFRPQEDAQACYEADEEIAQDERGHVRLAFEEWRRRKISEATLMFLAWDGNKVAGLVSGETMGDQGWIGHLGVRHSWRKQGLGMRLLRHIQREFYQRGMHKMTLNVDTLSSTGAFRLYERAGMHTLFQYHTYEKELRAGKDLRIH